MSPADAYLQPIVDKYGEHKGLNASWATMAWLVFGDNEVGQWLLDDESPDETVSAVLRLSDGEIIPIFQGTVAEALEFVGGLK